MKTYLIIFILVLCFTCWLGDSHSPPSSEPAGINDVSGKSYGAKHQEDMIPDFRYNDSPRNSPYITRIEDNTNGHEAEFPMGTK